MNRYQQIDDVSLPLSLRVDAESRIFIELWVSDIDDALPFHDSPMSNLIDKHTRENLIVRPERRWSSVKVIEALADVIVMKGVLEYIRSDNGPEFVGKDLRKWLADILATNS
jgi:hypothetical protein